MAFPQVTPAAAIRARTDVPAPDWYAPGLEADRLELGHRVAAAAQVENHERRPHRLNAVRRRAIRRRARW